ncbi:GNAT family N-acetyltransferase [Agromyces arachidis]|uniref:GNAT family N-acetyltransferase n=1 Tax=Agromyces arachidis TaxID=766966 RepID=UPI004057725B
MTDDATLARATARADEADRRSGIRTREARPDELAGALARFDATWGVGRTVDLASLKAIAHAGNTVLVAVPEPGRADAAAEPAEVAAPVATPIGAALGFLGWADGLHVHSHMNAVDPAARGRGVGVALKLRQRAICLEHGIDEVRWTYDPLIRRNARMNLVRLGAEVIAYRPDFYGELRDAISGGDRSDRFEVRWRLTSPRVERALDRVPQPEWRGDAGLALVPDFEAVRAEDPDAAAALRRASREAFAALADGRLRPELDAAGDYVFTADDPDRAA